MKVFITGVSGQDGSYMTDYLLKKFEDIEIYGAVRRLSVPNHKNVDHITDPRFRIVDFDLTDPYNIQNKVREIQPDYFINFAAQSFVGASWDNPVMTFEVNAMGVLHCLEAIRLYSPKTRFYHASTSETFGDVMYVPQDESHPIRPRSPYGAAKAAAGHLVKVYRDSYGIYATQGVLFNHESCRRSDCFVTQKIAKNVGRIKRSMDSGVSFDPLELGNMDSRRDWSHAEDFMDGVWRILNQDTYSKNWSGTPKDFVLASGETHTVKEFVEKSFLAAGIKGKWSGKGKEEKFFETESNALLVRVNPEFYRPAEVDLLLGNPTKAIDELGWKQKKTFESLVEEMTVAQLKFH